MQYDVIPVVESLITAPAAPAMTVEYARAHIRSIGNQEDHLVRNWILAATDYFERHTGRQVVRATYEAWLDAFPTINHPRYGLRIEVPRPPLQQVLSVRYVDGASVLQSVSDGGSPDLPLYRVKAPAGPYAARGWVEPTAATWPTAGVQGGAVRVQFVAGYGASEDEIPELVTGVLCYLIGHFDRFREAVQEAARGPIVALPLGVQQLIDEFKYSAKSSAPPRGLSPWGS